MREEFRVETVKTARSDWFTCAVLTLPMAHSAASITADRYEYIRNEQRDIKLPWNGLLPQTNVTPMPPLDEAKSKPLGTP